MKLFSIKSLFLFFVLIPLNILIVGCKEEQSKEAIEPQVKLESELIASNQKSAIALMERHLDAVSNKDLVTLMSTLSPNGMMQLILPQSEITSSVEEFMTYHESWFAMSGWTFETKILNSEVGTTMAMIVVEVIYREQERDGKPYFNRMIVSYDLQKMNDQWFVIKDHASSVEKSTDSEE